MLRAEMAADVQLLQLVPAANDEELSHSINELEKVVPHPLHDVLYIIFNFFALLQQFVSLQKKHTVRYHLHIATAVKPYIMVHALV